ncbi:MAG: hypothetical protein DPW11_03010 [bacterium]|nr:hypothetical protein [Candidatus Microgenomates bacterium CPR3]MCQ3944720.1 hypothetical protein [bacterium]RIK51861.1 MAG: hypothetical protein DCC61_01410 [Candidatus Microgenomates bacterium]
MKTALYIVLSLVAIILIYLRFSYGGSTTVAPVVSPTSMVSTPSPSPKVSLSETINNEYFTISHSSSATTSASRAPDSREWVISYMGEEQKKSGRTQTELWDGYVLAITRFETVGDDPDKLQAEVDRKGIIDACSEENATPIKSGKVGDYETITFYGGCLGEGDYHYLMLADTLYRLIIMAFGSDQAKLEYQVVVNSMLNSLRFK